MPEMHPARVAWRKNRHSQADGSCVEATVVTSRDGLQIPAGKADTPKLILLRDSKNPDGGTLVFDEHEWSAFIAGVKDGEFDLPESAP